MECPRNKRNNKTIIIVVYEQGQMDTVVWTHVSIWTH